MARLTREQLFEKLCGCHGSGGKNKYCTLREIILDDTLKAYFNGTFEPSENADAHREVIEDITEGCRNDCRLKQIALEVGISDRGWEQFKCVERFKFERGIYDKKTHGWEEAYKLWVKEGYAAKFASVYRLGMSYDEIYDRLTGARHAGCR